MGMACEMKRYYERLRSRPPTNGTLWGGLLLLIFCLEAAATAAGPTIATILLSEEQEIQLALEAGPKHIRKEATVYVFGAKGYQIIRNGTNGFTCMVNRDGNQSNDYDLKPTCWDSEGSRTIVPVMLRVGELIAKGITAEQIKRDIDTGFSNGRFVSPRKTGIAYMLKGDLQFDPQTRAIIKRTFPPHYMIYSPRLTNADIGVEMNWERWDHAQPFVYEGYSGGAHTAYIIVPAAVGCSRSDETTESH